jgi:radical SAM superfamily enzyme YgiQ (UPF0313 family)
MRVYKALCARLGRKAGFRGNTEYSRMMDAAPALASELLDREVERILADAPDVVGFSVLVDTEKWSLEMARRVKRGAPACRVVFGGAQCLREALSFDFIRYPAVDAVLLGEADLSLPALLRAIPADGGSMPSVPGVLVKNGDEILDGGDPEVVEDLDTLPFLDFSQFPMDDYSEDIIFINTSRGCVRKCGFCTHIVQQKTYRTMSPKRTLAEIRHQLSRYPHRHYIDFNDSLVNGDVRRLGEISDLLKEYRLEKLVSDRRAGLEIPSVEWGGMAILHPTMTRELLARMKHGGCQHLKYGLESASQKVVDAMEKHFDVRDAQRVIRDSAEVGIEVYLFVMVGFPGEGESEFQETLDFIEKNAAHLTGVLQSVCQIQRGSRLSREPEAFGIETPWDDTRWRTKDGSNTYDIRMERLMRLGGLCDRLGLSPVQLLPRAGPMPHQEFQAAADYHALR